MEIEKTGIREREREAAPGDVYEMVLYQRKKFVEHQLMGKVLVRDRDRDWEITQQGRLKYYLQPHTFKDPVLVDWQVFKHDVRIHSGKHTHQGGLVIFVLEGKGYTTIGGVRYDWEAGDLILLPTQPGGVEHQHFNLDPGKPCKWIAFIYWPYWDALGSEMTQGELSPDYKAQK